MVTVFKETQKFTQWWIWLLMILIVSSTILPPIYYGNMNSEFILSTIVVVGVILLFLFWKQITIIDQQKVQLRVVPFINRSYSWSDIEEAQVIKYGFVGGWGIRYSGRYGWVYNVKGSEGLFLKLKNGNTLVIGTQEKEILKTYLENRNKTKETL